MGNKARPFYRVVVAKSDSGRDAAVHEVLGTYSPITKEKALNLDEERALHWLRTGAQPTETAAILLKRTGVLDRFFAERPKAKASYKFLDKRTAAMSTESVISAPVAAEAAPAPAPEPTPAVEEAPVADEAAAPEATEEAAPESTEENS